MSWSSEIIRSPSPAPATACSISDLTPCDLRPGRGRLDLLDLEAHPVGELRARALAAAVRLLDRRRRAPPRGDRPARPSAPRRRPTARRARSRSARWRPRGRRGSAACASAWVIAIGVRLSGRSPPAIGPIGSAADDLPSVHRGPGRTADRSDARGHAPRRLRRPPPSSSVREPRRIVRGHAGRAPRSGRTDPRVRALTRAVALRGPARRDRRRGECDRNDQPACADPGRADPEPIPSTAHRVHGKRRSRFRVRARQRRGGGRTRKRGPAPAKPLVACGHRLGRGAGRQRSEALRRDAERDVRRADHAERRPQQSGADERASPGAHRRLHRARRPRRLPVARRARRERRPDRLGSGCVPAVRDRRPRPTHAGVHHRARHRSRRRARCDAKPPAAGPPFTRR